MFLQGLLYSVHFLQLLNAFCDFVIFMAKKIL